MQLRSGALLQGGKYKIEGVIAQGGFGITYRAVQIGLDRVVAIKEFFWKTYCNREENTRQVSSTSANGDTVCKFLEKFIKEAKTIAALNNPHVVKIYDVFEENGTAYYVMEMLEPDDLNQRIPAGGFDERTALKYISQIGDALTYVHKRKILHLDVKPSNVMFRSDGDAVLIDFGVSKRYDKEGGQTSATPVGVSKGYAPIEQFNQQLSSFSPATDVYSLAATLYKLLTGKNPPDASMVADEGLPPFPPKVSDRVARAVEKGMSPRRIDRPQSVAEFLESLTSSNSYANAAEDETVLVTDDSETIVEIRPSGNVSRQKPPHISPVNPLLKTVVDVNTVQQQSNVGGGKRNIIITAAVVLMGLIFGFVLVYNTEDADDSIKIVDYSSVGMYPMVKVKGGSFVMGSEQTDENDCPPHRVSVDDFYIGQFEVSQKFWKAIMGSNPSINDGVYPVDSLPVDNVKYEDIQVFINKLNAKTGRNFSLPTEAQWEYAARGGEKSTGKTFAGNNTPRNIWFDKNRSFKVKKSDSVNELEIYQMSGNVAEICEDYYNPDYYIQSDGERNPLCNVGNKRVVRGGSYCSSDPEELTVFYREAENKPRPYVGFRLVMNY